VTAPIWLLFLFSGLLLSLQARFIRPEYFPSGRSLFPDWPRVDPVRAEWVFIGTMVVLLAPKLLGFIVLLTDGAMRRGCGGALRGLLSVLIETLIAGLLAPVAMLSQSHDVAAILIGRDSGWITQRRDEAFVNLQGALRAYAWHTVFGLILAVAAYLVSWSLFVWMLPVILGLSLAIPLAAFTAQETPGRTLRKLGLLMIPEERCPPAVLSRMAQLRRSLEKNDGKQAVPRLLGDRRLLDAHRAMLPPIRRRRDPIEPDLVIGLARLADADSLAEAQASLTAKELTAVLNDHRGLDQLLALSGTDVMEPTGDHSGRTVVAAV
jgi:membrane glycosyltransferase